MSVFLLSLLQQAQAATLTVGPSQSYSNIQSAVTASQSGDTIEVYSGTYLESVQLGNKELSIIGVDGVQNTVIQSLPGLPAISMNGQSATLIQGFTIQPSSSRGFQLLSASPTLIDLIVEGGTVTGQGGGMFVSGGAPIISNVVFQNNTANSGGDIYGTSAANISIVDSVFINSQAVYGGSVYLGSSSNINLSSSTFESSSGTYGGVLYALTSSVNITDVDINGAFSIYEGAGLYLHSSVIELLDTTINSVSSTQGRGNGVFATDSSVLNWVGGGVFDAHAQNVGHDGGAMSFEVNSVATLENIDIEDGSAYRGGGIFLSSSTLNLNGVTLENNASVLAGGALYAVDGSTVTSQNCNYIGNLSSAGGAIELRSYARFYDEGSAFQYNQASGEEGGAIRAEDNAFLDLLGSSFTVNTSYLDGGAVYLDDLIGAVQVMGVSLVSNTSEAGDGGAIAVNNALDLFIEDSQFLGNTAADHGGGISYIPSFIQSEGIEVLESDFISNIALRGGAVSVRSAGFANIMDSIFQENEAVYLDGGGLRLDQIEQIELVRDTFVLNQANQSGGAVWLSQNHWVSGSILNGIFVENTADRGGAIANTNSTVQLIIENNSFAGNQAFDFGAHLYLDSSSVSFVNNLAMYGKDGGGLHAIDQNSVTDSDFYYNSVYENTGGDTTGFIGNLFTQTGNIGLEPLVYAYSLDGIYPNDNLHLQLISPLRDQGDPTLLDVDGTRSDIGAYGGLEAAAFDIDGDGFYDITDCDDSLISVYPYAPEVPYDGIDQDCLDGDLVDVDGDGFESDITGGLDCDDSQMSIYPGASDTWYDGVDANCDGLSDFDSDGDGFDWNLYGGNDCDDSSASISPAMQELWYDGADQNCDGLSDYDADGDGQDSQGYGGDDCNENDPSIFSGAPEVPYDGIDQDCDGSDLIDSDYDGWVATEVGGPDCNDSSPTVYPGATETWYDGIDSDCAGDDDYDADGDGQPSSLFGGSDCDDTDPTIYLGGLETWYDGLDSDCAGDDDFDADLDGQSSSEFGGDDCNDMDPNIYLGAEEQWYDGIDSDCLGGDDYDADGDGFSLDTPSTPSSDCDDTNPNIYPDAEEVFDGLDNDCDGFTEQDDRDDDGLIDWHEWMLFSDPDNPDTDGDSQLDGEEVSTLGDELVPFDTDDDGIQDIFDTDDDDDGIETYEEMTADIDNDGTIDKDVDGDEIYNHRDKDSDGDGLSDLFEGTKDSDFDGIPDYLDYAGDLKGNGCQTIRLKSHYAFISFGLLGFISLRRRRQ